MGEIASYEGGKIFSFLVVLPAVNIVLWSTTATERNKKMLTD